MNEVIKPSAAWIEAHLVEVVERCMKPKPVMCDGKPTGVYTFNANGALRALELAAKLLDLFSKTESKALQPIVFNLDFPAKHASEE